MHSDPIADMLTRIRNAQAVKKATVVIPFSRLNQKILSLLKETGYIKDIVLHDTTEEMEMEVELLYDRGEPKIRHIRRISKPGQRQYRRKNALPTVLNNYGIAIISTNQGLMTNKEAKEKHVGGEILCEVY